MKYINTKNPENSGLLEKNKNLAGVFLEANLHCDWGLIVRCSGEVERTPGAVYPDRERVTMSIRI